MRLIPYTTIVLLSALVVLCIPPVSGESLPGNWKISGGTAETYVFAVSSPSDTNFATLDSSLWNAPKDEKKWAAGEDFSVEANETGFAFTSTYKRALNKLAFKGECRRYKGDGLYFSMAIVPRERMDSLWVKLNLPYDAIVEKNHSVNGKFAGKLLFRTESEIKAYSLVLAEGHPGQISLQFASRLPILFKKESSGGKDVLGLYININGGQAIEPGKPVFLTARMSQRDLFPRPYCSVTHVFSDEVPRYGVFEAAFQFMGLKPSTPYDLSSVYLYAVVADEFGSSVTVVPFFIHPFGEYEEDDGKKGMTPSSRPYFLVRYSPRNTGKYAFRLFAGEGDATYSSAPTVFRATESDGGFVIISPKDKRYLMLSSDKSFFPIGFNLAWEGQSLPSDFDGAFKRMARSGINATRVWISTWGINVDDAKSPFGFNQKALSVLDSVFESALRYGIKVILVLTNHKDLNENYEKLPFRRPPGEENKAEFFLRDEKAIGDYKTRVHYLTTRYSAYSSLFAFEPGNELDYSTNVAPLTTWTREIAHEIRLWDINRHLITASLGLNGYDKLFWDDSNVDLLQFHGYSYDLAFIKDDIERSALKMVDYAADKLRESEKPGFLAEFGYAVTDDAPGFNAVDTEGLHLHNALWASLSNGLAGTSFNWWWDSHIFPNDLLYHYRGISLFVSGVDFGGEGFTAERSAIGDVDVRLLRGDMTWLGWFSSTDNNWVDMLAGGKNPQLHTGLIYELKGLKRGLYRIEWWDTRKAVTVNSFSSSVSDGKLKLQVPKFVGDIALKVIAERLD